MQCQCPVIDCTCIENVLTMFLTSAIISYKDRQNLFFMRKSNHYICVPHTVYIHKYSGTRGHIKIIIWNYILTILLKVGSCPNDEV